MRNFIFLFTCLLSLKSWSFTLNNSATLTFNKDNLVVNIARVTSSAKRCQNIGINEDELLSIARDAVELYWNRAPTSRLKMKGGSLISTTDDFADGLICNAGTSCDPNPSLSVSNDILVACNQNTTNFSSSGVLAVTVPNNISGRTILGSLILINDLPSNQFKYKSRDEKISIIAHEIGHTIGLGHSPVKDSLMYYAMVDIRQSLGADDIDGISYLYPKQQPFSCGSISLDSDKKNPNAWLGLLIGFLLIAGLKLILTPGRYEWYLKLRPRF